MAHADDRQMDIVRERSGILSPHPAGKGRRLLAAFEARSLGYGGTSRVSEATGIARSTTGRGLKELDGTAEMAGDGRVRREGAGRRRSTDRQPGLEPALRALVEPATRGDPQQALLWVSKSSRHLAKALKEQGYQVSRSSVARLLKGMGCTLQPDAKIREGSGHPDRDAQFRHMNQQAEDFISEGQPVISVDARKKELVGNFRNAGRTWRPKGQPEEVNVHDFVDKELGKAAPCGVFDVANSIGWVNAGVSHDTAAFAVESVRRWCGNLGQERFPDAERLLVTADCGGSNGSRVRLWKAGLQKLATGPGLEISVCHLPPAASRWNRMEHRLFPFISMNWRGKPLRDLATIISLIRATTTEAGLKVCCDVDENHYPKGISVDRTVMDALSIRRDPFRGEWNFTFLPAPRNEALI